MKSIIKMSKSLLGSSSLVLSPLFVLTSSVVTANPLFAGFYCAMTPEYKTPVVMRRKDPRKKKIKECPEMVEINKDFIITESVSIPSNRVTSWKLVKRTSNVTNDGSLAAGAAFSVITGGFLAGGAFGAQRIISNWEIDGYDSDGNKLSIVNLQFRDANQPEQFAYEMTKYTGLSNGEMRSLKDIQGTEKENCVLGIFCDD